MCRTERQWRCYSKSTTQITVGPHDLLRSVEVNKHLRGIFRNIAPASVGDTPRVVRARSCMPRSASSLRRCLLTIALARPSLRAAFVKLPALAVSTKVLNPWICK
jgi:hypothetical protein